MAKIIIEVENRSVTAELNDTPTAQKILDALPFESSVNTWGDEIYFDIPLTIEQASDTRAGVEVGDLAYWPPGPAFCIFFGPTPASTDKKPRAASPVNVFGRVTDDPMQFKSVSNGAKIKVSKAD